MRKIRFFTFLLALFAIAATAQAQVPTTTYTVADVSLTGTGLKYVGPNGYYPDGFHEGLELTFSGGSNPSSEYIDMAVMGIYTDVDENEHLKTNPQDGTTYYAHVLIYASSACPNNVVIDFSQVSSAKVSITISGFDVTVTSASQGTMNGRPSIEIDYSITKQAPDLPELTFTPWSDFELTYGNTDGDVAGKKSALLSGIPTLGVDEYEYATLRITNTNLVNVDDPNDILVMALKGNWDPSDNLKYYSPLLVDGQEIEYTETSGYGNESIQTLVGQKLEYIYIDNFGTAEDFAKVKDVLAGKIAVCNRGDISFYIKANAAMANGAIGIIIVNNVEGVINMNLTGYEYTNPAIAITMADGALLKEKGEFVDGDAPYYVGTLEMGELAAGHTEMGLGFGKDYYLSGSHYYSDYEIKALVPDWTNATPGATYKATITYSNCNYYIWRAALHDYDVYPVEIGTQSTTVTVTIPKAVTITIDPTEVEATLGEPFESPDITIDPTEVSLSDGTALWKSSDESVATVDPATGEVTLVGEGTTTITVSYPGNEVYLPAEASYTLTVNKAEPNLSYDVTEVSGKHGEDFTAPTLNNPNGLTVTYKSSDESVATVDPATGEVTLQGEGTVTITAQFEGNDTYLAGEASYIIYVDRHDGIPVIEEFFPDEAFRKFVADNLDLDGDGWLEDDEIAAVTELEVFGLGIKDLTGVEYLTELEMLYCYENELTELDVTVFPKLRGLYCFSNQLIEIDVTQNPLLQYFFCYNNQLTDIDVTKNPNLIVLDVSQNLLTALDV
ncbi:MAG: Ig-like domain-containing protein [Prevotella sp.]|nr:Ig-like domain-containing protein [Prevotella sp.]